MSIQNSMAAKILGNIIAEGMSISDFDLSDTVKSEAISALDGVKIILDRNDLTDHDKTEAIQKIFDYYNL